MQFFLRPATSCSSPNCFKEGYPPHMPREVWVSLTEQPNVTIDISDTWPVKLEALKEHKSQIGDPAKFEERMRKRHTEDSTDEQPRFEERFRVLRYKQVQPRLPTATPPAEESAQ